MIRCDYMPQLKYLILYINMILQKYAPHEFDNHIHDYRRKKGEKLSNSWYEICIFGDDSPIRIEDDGIINYGLLIILFSMFGFKDYDNTLTIVNL